MNVRRLVRHAGAAAVAAGLTLAGTVTAAAAATTPVTSSPTASPAPSPGAALAALKARCNSEVQRRLASLSADRGFIDQAAALTASDRAALLQIVSTDIPALTALDATIQADTTLQKAHDDCQQIVLGYRVYVLQEPKMHEVIAADTVSSADSALRNLAVLLAADIKDANLPPAARQVADAALADLDSRLVATETAISGVSASLLPLTPAGYPTVDVPVLQKAATSIRTAREDLEGARHDVDVILGILGR